MFFVLVAIFVAGVLVSLRHGVYRARTLPRHRAQAEASALPPGSEPLSPS